MRRLRDRFAQQGLRAIFADLTRFGGAAAINTVFGYSAYALFVWVGLEPFIAQIVAQVVGALFNSRTYAIAFRSGKTSKGRFIATYILNYGINFMLLALFRYLVGSPYLAGFLALAVASTLNFLILRNFVFANRAPPV